MTKKVLILGCGPSGMLATHALVMGGAKVTILSRKEKSYIAGAQYLHSHIPDVNRTTPDGVLTVYKIGSEIGYSKKIYGVDWRQTSWGRYEEGEHSIWNMRTAYNALWNSYHSLVMNASFFPELLGQACKDYDAVISTIPLPSLFPDCKYEKEEVWIREELPVEKNSITYNGLEPKANGDARWYRKSCIFGHAFTEYPTRIDVEPPNAKRIVKPLRVRNLPTLPNNLWLMGRYGTWEKGVLVDDAYREAAKVVKQL